MKRLDHGQLTAEGCADFVDGVKLWRTGRRKGLVKILAAQVRFACNLAHSLRLGDIADCGEKQLAIPRLKGCVQVFLNYFRAVKIFACVPFSGCYFHGLLLQCSHDDFGLVNIPVLAGFIPAAEEKHDIAVLDGVINAETGAKEKTQLKEIDANSFMISKISKIQAVKSVDDPRSVSCVLERGKPFIKNVCGFNFVFHCRTKETEGQGIIGRERREKGGKGGQVSV